MAEPADSQNVACEGGRITNESITFESTSKTVATAKGSIHSHDVGRGDPLIFVHCSRPGVGGWANFEGNLAAFSQHYRCLVPDLPGFGSSDANGEHPVVHGRDAIAHTLPKTRATR